MLDREQFEEIKRLRSLGDHETVRAILERLLLSDKNDPLALWQLGYTHLDLGDPKSAIPLFSATLKLEPESIPAWGGLGHASMELEDWCLAQSHFSTRISIAESDNHYVFLSISQFEQGKFEEASLSARKAIALDPSNDEGYLNLAFAQEAMGLLGDAIESMNNALRLDPSNTFYQKVYRSMLAGQTRGEIQPRE